MRSVHIFDTTLRDGLKIPGVFLLPEERIQIAKQIQDLGVDVIEGGFPAASESQYKTLLQMADVIKDTIFCVLARATNPEDFKSAGEVLKRVAKPRVHTFVPVSKSYRDHFLKKSLEDTLELAEEAIKRGFDIASEVEFSLVDAFRADEDDIIRMVEVALEAGATVVNLADTVGYATPWGVEDLFSRLVDRFGNEARFSIHCHNDLGVAVANSIMALKAGAAQVHCTVNGIGERAGNASLEEIAAFLKSHAAELNLSTSIKLERIYQVCRIVERHTGIAMSPLKPLTGSNAFTCDATIPQLGDATDTPPFYILTPQDLGVSVVGNDLDRDTTYETFKDRVAALGYLLTEDQYEKCYKRFKELADKKEQIFRSDLELIVHQTLYQVPQKYKLLYLNVTAGSIPVPHATVQMEIDGQIVQDAGFGHGPVDATFKTIFRMAKRFPKLIHYEVNAATSGTDAQGEVLLRLQEGDVVVDGRGANIDIVLASAHALVDALNKLEHYGQKQEVSEYTDEEGWTIIL